MALAVAACILVVVAMLMLSQTVQRTEPFVANAATVLRTLVQGNPRRGTSLGPDNTASFYTRDPKVSLQVVYNDVVLLPRRVVVDKTRQRVVADLVNPYQVLLTNTLTFPTLRIDPFVATGGNVTFDSDAHRCFVYGPGRMQLRNYINTPIPRVGYSLKLTGPLGDIEAHNVARAPQDTLVTPEVAKFADILGVTVLYEIVDPDDFALSFLLRKPGKTPTFVSLAARGPDLKLTSFEHGGMRSRDARSSMALGDAHRNQWIKNGVLPVKTFKDALAGASGVIKIKMELVPGRVRCFVEGPNFRRAYVIAMGEMLKDAGNLQTDPSNPPQMAWRATNGKLRIFPFPLGDLSFDEAEVVRKA